jgi:hypothetical protein
MNKSIKKGNTGPSQMKKAEIATVSKIIGSVQPVEHSATQDYCTNSSTTDTDCNITDCDNEMILNKRQ